jgi:hypothetical protein
MGRKGRVVVRIQTHKDERWLNHTPTVEGGSEEESLGTAVVGAIRSSAPFVRLPEAYRGPKIELRLTFLHK